VDSVKGDAPEIVVATACLLPLEMAASDLGGVSTTPLVRITEGGNVVLAIVRRADGSHTLRVKQIISSHIEGICKWEGDTPAGIMLQVGNQPSFRQTRRWPGGREAPATLKLGTSADVWA